MIRPGYWNFTTENPDGCQQCTCNIHGTVQSANGGCDEDTGDCTCKPHVKGRQCDQFCLEGFYKDPEKELNHPDACLPCNCNLDGTVLVGDRGDTSCTSSPEDGEVHGQCNCKPHVKGRQCDQFPTGVLKDQTRLFKITVAL